MSARLRVACLAALLVLGGCASGREPAISPPAPQPATSDTQWTSTRTAAVRLAEMGRYGDADSLLARFAARHTGTPQGAAALYWRALLHLDPANPTTTPRDAIAAIDAYLAGGAAQPHYEELLVLRRTAGHLERIRLLAAEAERVRSVVPATDSSTVVIARQAEEITKLKSELEKALGELERLRRRIRPEAAPPPH